MVSATESLSGPRSLARRRAGEDVPVQQGDDLSILQIVNACEKEAHSARRSRLARNRQNMDTYMGIQDFSHKIDGQSSEFLPKVSISVEQLAAFGKRALTQFGRWFQFKFGRHLRGRIPLKEEEVETILLHYLDNLPTGDGKSTKFATRLGDALKVGALESLMVFKVYGQSHKERAFHVEVEMKDEELKPELKIADRDRWRLHIDLVKPEDYLPDPTGQGMYEIHKLEVDLHHVIELAEKGVYDKQAVAMLKISSRRKEEERRKARMLGQDESEEPQFRIKVVLKEFWGTLVNSEGKVVKKNIVCTVANDQFLIRKPEDNPNWHGHSPFVAIPLIRVPWSVWHKALYDPAADLNIALNEIFNLILDGGLASVWGTRQLRAEHLENPGSVSGGIPQGKTLVVKDSLPPNVKVLETVTEGKVPQDALAVMNMVNQEFTMASLSSELRQGQFPSRRVLATEIAEISASQGTTLDSIAGDIETGIAQILSMSWLSILQDMDIIEEELLQTKLSTRSSLWLAQLEPVQRFALLAMHGSFVVSGLSAIMSKARDFQKLAALLNLASQSPILLQAFIKRYSGDKWLTTATKMLNLNPAELEKDEDELLQVGAEMQMALALGGGRGQGGGQNAQTTGEQQLPAEINQTGNPLTGLSAS
ncbi:MAG: hypothetical protein L0Y56_01885 [Nitrospira sp.]|nr:hypothetical protein [Nitrospira sp.]